MCYFAWLRFLVLIRLYVSRVAEEDGIILSEMSLVMLFALSSVCIGIDGALPAEQVLPASLERMPSCP